ncbi:MAG: DUF1565 domain-containing protein [Clostridiales bacterium]|nr:DUF1565 domain-containing protein [Clostridiales bacterium]
MTYHVAKTGTDTNPGTEAEPFLTISKAASVARAGDTITVHEGEYREWVKPPYGGMSDMRRIVYTAAEGERVVIKGSERVTAWENIKGNVWKATVQNSIFGDYNPFSEIVIGDWLVYPVNRQVHLGDVYLNGKSFYEAKDLAGVYTPDILTQILDHWTKEMVPVKDVEQTKYRWFAEVAAKTTTIYANFQGADPTEELVEINVRKCCFYPDKPGMDFITLRGFEVAQAACPWTPPTGDQPGMIGAHWSRGWIIENNIVHDAKCSAISIGKEGSTGNNFRTFRRDKPGYQYQLESVFTALKYGWSKETIGSHLIRNNVIHDCGQNAVVGHLGCVFSEIYDNHIYNIAIKREFYGHEIAGIKLHAAIDVVIRHNHIHDCSLGIWLDWQAQGTRVSKNLFYHNNRDLFIEVTHGPCLIDNNILGSKYCLDNHAQGSAYIHNLFAGLISPRKMLNRATPYHSPHSTDVTGYAMVYGWDDRVYQNLFVGGQTTRPVGTSIYDGCTTSLEEYMARVDALDAVNPGDLNLFEAVEQPAYISSNCYLNGAEAFCQETDKFEQSTFDAEYSIEAGDEVYLNITLPEGFDTYVSPSHSTATLNRVRIVDADFENPDGSALCIDSDFMDVQVNTAVCGPIAGLTSGKNRIKVWG